MSALLALSVGMARAWVALYTIGLPAGLRDARRQEIECDLWEHRRFAELTGSRPAHVAWQMVLRVLFGMTADIGWRVQAGLPARSGRSSTLQEGPVARGVLFLGCILAALPIAAGVSVGIAGDVENMGQRLFYSSTAVLGGLFMLGGLLLSRREPRLGLGLVALGIAVIAASWPWAARVTVPFGLLLGVVAFFRARRTGWPNRTGAV